MKKYLVETYYTCTFKTVHSLDELNEKSMAEVDNRDDGTVEVIEVKLNNRKTKKVGENSLKEEKREKRVEIIDNNIKKKVNNLVQKNKSDIKNKFKQN